ncbi:MAG: hypothetical protein JST26_13380 [Bacteroidetes bacterium]|nr:hypothetical protein [Bacteroidota bacterium]
MSSKRSAMADTLKREDVNPLADIDELLATEYFEYRGKMHSINMYCSDRKAPVDGGKLKYTLDSLGMIYGRSTTWPSYIRLRSNNDSINDLIQEAYSYMLMKSSLHCFHCHDEFTHNP